ncbi:MAG: hypothetical protein LBC95_02175 [Candidatus Nomurabacteria bacterium]|jgi:hypothetical protein|nr:hypothetical protein [Candidatus Nomurabacteria bacterium]
MTRYKLIYNINKDIWNWRGGTKQVFFGNNYAANARFIEDEAGREIAKEIEKLNKPEAEKLLRPYLTDKKKDPSSRLNNFITLAENEFTQKFDPAVNALEKITQQPMMADDFTFYITTFPRMPYFYDKREIFIFDSTAEIWGLPIDGVLHELLHFQFEHYWREDKKSPISKLSLDEYNYLKEALTVVLDTDLQPIISVPDAGHAVQAEFREILHEHWQKHHNFDKLIEFGLEKIPKEI